VPQFELPMAVLDFQRFCSSSMFAHVGDFVSFGGLAHGLLHPLTGLDHLLAMVAVGILGSQLGGRAIWILPFSFVTCMIFGSSIGMASFALPAIESGIAVSVIVLGIAIAMNHRFPASIPLACAGLFGFVHGFAHGSEFSVADNPVAYVAGFVLATALLHVAGIGIASQVKSTSRGLVGLRVAGTAIALAGCWLALAY
jgi:urease accessory protein